MRFLVLLSCLFIAINSELNAEKLDVWIGTSGNSGIYYLTLDTETGKLSKPVKAAELPGAGFLVLNRNANKLYATGREKTGRGEIVAFEISKGDAPVLKRINSQSIPNGHHPTHINFDREFRYLMTAQYGGRSVTVFRMKDDGSIGELVESIEHQGGSKAVPGRQDSPHPHWIGTNISNDLVAVPDLGLDQVVTYKFDSSTGKLSTATPWKTPRGGGPRHMKFHPNGIHAYVLNELSLSVSVFELTDVGTKNIQTIASLPQELKDKRLNSAAEIRIHPNGRFLYTSNRGHDSISVFAIDEATGKLQEIQRVSIRGSWPRNFDLDAAGKWLIAAGSYSNTLALFEIERDGTLQFTRNIENLPGPICVSIQP